MSEEVIVLGGGLAGLSAAYHIGERAVLYERESYLGGHCRTKRVDGFNFDEGAHVFFGRDEISQKFVWEPLGDEMHGFRAEIWNDYVCGRFGRYPVQANAHAIGPEAATRCVVDFIAAAQQPEGEVRTYEDWCYASFGRAFSEEYMFRYARKVWTVEPRELTTEWLGSKVSGRISRPSLEQVVRGAIDPEPHELNYLTEFWYPASGGFGRLIEPLLKGVKRVHTGCGVERIESTARRIVFANGSERGYETAISTIPLPALVALTVDAPDEVRVAAGKLMWTSIRCVNIGIERADIGPGHWVYFYDEGVPFFRISFPSKFAPGNAPSGCGSVTCEVAYSRRKPIDEEGLTEKCVGALRDAGILRADDRIVVADQIDVPYAYVVFDFERAESLRVIHEWMRSVGLEPCGRFGEWGYHWSFEAIESGRRAAQRVGGDAAPGIAP